MGIWGLRRMVARSDLRDWQQSDIGVRIPAKRYRIGEIVRSSSFSRQTIHNYTIMGLIHEAEWTEGGHRLYDETVFERLARIAELRKTKSLAQIRHLLTEEEGTGARDTGSGREPPPTPTDSPGPAGARGGADIDRT
jgi:hypothetical protein